MVFLIWAMIQVSDLQNWDNLKKTITKVLGFNCTDYSDKFLARRVEVRLRALNLDSYQKYSVVLSSDPAEKDRLSKELTIHVTHFFRDIDFYESFKKEVLPELIEHKKSKNQKTIRVWSAGCSTGEEPYGIAICFADYLKQDLSKWDIKIIGTDYDMNTVLQAKKGVYEDFQFRETPQNYKDNYFRKEGTSYAVVDSIKNKVEFSVGDILSNNKPKSLDIIFCRNTVIYFDSPAKSQLYVDFFNSLNDAGYLFLEKPKR
jgi:chemotaxis protein methyltransferase CheR